MPDAWTLFNMQRTSATILYVVLLQPRTNGIYNPEIVGTTIANIRKNVDYIVFY